MKSKKQTIKWFKGPEAHDYPAAESYLSLVFTDGEVKDIVSRLKKAAPKLFKAKDIYRASNKSILGVSNSHVEANIRKIKKGKKMSPILLVRDTKNRITIIADGYHRLCGVYHFNEDCYIPCRIVTI